MVDEVTIHATKVTIKKEKHNLEQVTVIKFQQDGRLSDREWVEYTVSTYFIFIFKFQNMTTVIGQGGVVPHMDQFTVCLWEKMRWCNNIEHFFTLLSVCLGLVKLLNHVR